MKSLCILGLLVLSGCGEGPTYTFYCVTPVGIAKGEAKVYRSDATLVQFTTDTGVEVISPWVNCVGVKK